MHVMFHLYVFMVTHTIKNNVNRNIQGKICDLKYLTGSNLILALINTKLNTICNINITLLTSYIIRNLNNKYIITFTHN